MDTSQSLAHGYMTICFKAQRLGLLKIADIAAERLCRHEVKSSQGVPLIELVVAPARGDESARACVC
jgi:hypothetical protein